MFSSSRFGLGWKVDDVGVGVAREGAGGHCLLASLVTLYVEMRSFR